MKKSLAPDTQCRYKLQTTNYKLYVDSEIDF